MHQRHRITLPLLLPSLPLLLPLLLAILIAPRLLHAQQALNNAAVLQLAASGQSEEQIVQTIAASTGHYFLGTDARAEFKEAGVTDKEVDAMLAKNTQEAAAAAKVGTVVPPGVHERGVYYKDLRTDMWVQFPPEFFYYVSPKAPPVPLVVANEIVQMGQPLGLIDLPLVAVLLPFDIAYLIKRSKTADRNGYISGKTAQLEFDHPLDILIYAPEDSGPKNYPLVKLREHPDNHDVRVFERAGVDSGDPSRRDRQAFKATKLGFGFYQFTLGPERQPGEYAILLPDAAAPANAPGKGQILTFRVLE